MSLTEQHQRYLLDMMINLEKEMRMVGIEMMSSGEECLLLHGDELVDAAAIVKNWIDGFGEQCHEGKPK